MAGRLLRIPTLVSLAGGELVALPEIGYGDQRIAWERLKVRASLRLASAVSAGSLQLLRVAERRLATSNTFRKPHHAPLGVDLQLFSPTPAGAQATKRLFHVGSLTAVKDQVTLLHAFARLHRQDSAVSLEISGDGPLRQKLERVVGELGIAAAVSFSGEIDHAGLPAVYRAGTVFVVSSRHEAQCMVAIEAAACGLPIVGTCVGVIPELAGASGDAVLVGSPETLAVALSNALDDPTSRASFALDRARQHFSLEGCTNRFRALYAGLAD
jgi:glycosyltransferase involved in cell wall biosynthesis